MELQLVFSESALLWGDLRCDAKITVHNLLHSVFIPRNVSYDEKKFAQNPMGQNGGVDRMLTNLLWMRLNNYTDALAHLFNTGQVIGLNVAHASILLTYLVSFMNSS